MNLVDSCGWLEYFAGGPNAEFFAPPLEAEGDTLVAPTLCLYEVFKAVLSQFGREKAIEKAGAMRKGVLVALDDSLAMDAALISHQLGLPMADSIMLATARHCDATL